MTIRSYFALGLAWLGLAPWAFSQAPGKDARALAAFTKALQQDAFDVNPGAAFPMNLVQRWCTDTLPSWLPFNHALYSNSQPYLVVGVPKSASEPEPTKVSPLFQLGSEEAIVVIGLTPPPERYYGIYAFLRTRWNPDQGIRQPLWATLGDAVNKATVKTTGHTPFNSPVAVIFTSDQGTEARVRAALERAGYPAAIINTIVFPASILNLGHSDTADEFIIAIRNAMWQNQTDGDAYIQNPPLHVFRVTPRTETTGSPFPLPLLRVRGTGQSEMALSEKLDLLRQRILAANSGLYRRDVATQIAGYEGYDYIQRGIDPWGDARDALYLTGGYVPEFGSTDEITLADDEFLMIYGANHVATGKATYHSVNVYSSKEGKVPVGSAEDPAFSDSATQYLFDDPAAAKLMYAIKVSRNCGQEPNCVPLAIANCSKLTIGPNTVLGLFFRLYLEPATKVGPVMPEILYDRVIKFSPRPPAQQ
ncbi:MAG TPA: hypothetical protein VN428_17325 [Bryobacteraceae bacterium]|nr:hypothetical protein [Bryobacteraceae bacterium]